MLEITESAIEVLKRASDAATRLNPEAKVRVYKRGDSVDTSFADRPENGDEVIELDGLTLFVESGIEGTLDTSLEHDVLIVRPAPR